MIITSTTAEQEALLSAAKAMCAAARTAPKTKGVDRIDTMILTGEEKDALADNMDQLADALSMGFFHRDAANVRASQAVVLIGCESAPNGLNDACRFCGFENCKASYESGARCFFNTVDLGIAVGSAVSIAADHRIDNRVMFSVGRTAMEMKLMGDKICQILGIPLSLSGKSPFFDRAK